MTNAYLQSQCLAITAAGSNITTIHISITFINILIMSSNNPAQVHFIDDHFSIAHIADDAITAIINLNMTELLMLNVGKTSTD